MTRCSRPVGREVTLAEADPHTKDLVSHGERRPGSSDPLGLGGHVGGCRCILTTSLIQCGEALESLPERFLDELENVKSMWRSGRPVKTSKRPASQRGDGGPSWGSITRSRLPERGSQYMAFPDHITIYQKPIEAFAGPDEERIKEQVRQTVIHEIAHYYGIDDDRLDELG